MSFPAGLPQLPSSTKVIVVLDVVESVRLMEQDEHGFIRRWQEFVRSTCEQVLPAHGGRMHKSLGDGLMLEFGDAHGAVGAAFAAQHQCDAANAGLPPAQHIQLRIGAHLAHFVTDQYDIYGSDVNLTSRLATLAGPGELVVSASLRDQLVEGLDGEIEDLGECFLKHVERPVRAYRVGPAGTRPVIAAGEGRVFELRPTVAIIPFTLVEPAPHLHLVGEVLADELIAALSVTPALNVISRLSTTALRGRPDCLQEAKALLGASYVLSGRCRAAGSEIVIFAELAEASTGSVVWARQVRGTAETLLQIQNDVIDRMVTEISASILTREVNRVRTHALPTLEAHTLLLGAIALMHRNSVTDFERAQHALELLSERSRRHPLPQAWMAKWHVLKVQQGWSADPRKEGLVALECTKRALDNEPDCSLALAVDGLVRTNLLKDLDGALAQYERALDVNPNESLAWLLKGTLHAFRGEGDLAVDHAARATSLSPLDPIKYFYNSLAATAALSAGRYEEARTLARQSLRANRSHTSTLRVLAIAQVQLGELEQARQTVAELRKLEPGLTVSGYLSRSPSAGYSTGKLWSASLHEAGLPA